MWQHRKRWLEGKARASPIIGMSARTERHVSARPSQSTSRACVGANHRAMGTDPSMGGGQKPHVGLKDLAGADVRVLDSLDRAVLVLEGTSGQSCRPEDRGQSTDCLRSSGRRHLSALGTEQFGCDVSSA